MADRVLACLADEEPQIAPGELAERISAIIRAHAVPG